MIKRANNKKKKGFTLIELIIVLAVMAIIALIAIPNFSAVRNNSKVKADLQSCETIKRTVLMLVSDETIKGDGSITLTFDDTTGKIKAAELTKVTETSKDVVKTALEEVKIPQGKTTTGTKTPVEAENPNAYIVTITGGSVEVVTGAVKAGE